MPKTWRRSAFLLLVLVPVSFAGNAEPRRPTSPVGKEDQATVLVGAGDIADCKDLAGAEATAKLLDKISGTVMAVGDLAYPDGSKENFVCYDKTWGRAKSRTRPAAIMNFTLPEPRHILIILAWPLAIPRPATTATNLALGTSSY